MKFSCEKGLLQSACAIASRATASKSPIPALEGLLIEARGDVKITGYDLKEGIYTNIQADVAQVGSIVVGSRFFGEMIRRLPEGIVTVSTDMNNGVKVKCGKSEFNFMGISAEDYPEMPMMDVLNTISLPQKILRSMINQTIFAVADTDVRPIYTGTLFEVEGEVLTLVSVDGYRLAPSAARPWRAPKWRTAASWCPAPPSPTWSASAPTPTIRWRFPWEPSTSPSSWAIPW